MYEFLLDMNELDLGFVSEAWSASEGFCEEMSGRVS
jgi:hypothetical protein